MDLEAITRQYMGVSKNRGTPKWMVYNGKPYENGSFGGTTILGNTHIATLVGNSLTSKVPAWRKI